MELIDYLKYTVDNDCSDLYLTTGAPPFVKKEGVMQPIRPDCLVSGRVKELAYSIMTPSQIKDFDNCSEMNLALSEPGIGRFRVNIFQQRNQTAMVIRNIKIVLPTIKELGLPAALPELVMLKRGLVLIAGATGSGKSTTLAALIDHRNTTTAGHIITIEDPIEFVYQHKRSIVNQREVGVDTISYEEALKNTLRQAPDVILIGEIRSQETMEHAIAFAETGHLCISTLHANNANQALERIINFFPEERHQQLLLDLSLNLRGIVSQRLLPSIDGKRALAVEILLGTPLVRDLIKRGDVDEIKEIMHKSESLGMITFDNSLFHLFKANKITFEEALTNADSENNLRLRIQLDSGTTDLTKNSSLSLENTEENGTSIHHALNGINHIKRDEN